LNYVEFKYLNGSKCCAIVVPRVKSHDSFNMQAKMQKWIDYLHEHVSAENDKDDAAEWLITYLGKRNEDPFMLGL